MTTGSHCDKEEDMALPRSDLRSAHPVALAPGQCNALILALPLSIESFPIQFGVAWTASLASYFLPRQEYELNVEFSHSDKMVYNQAAMECSPTFCPRESCVVSVLSKKMFMARIMRWVLINSRTFSDWSPSHCAALQCSKKRLDWGKF